MTRRTARPNWPAVIVWGAGFVTGAALELLFWTGCRIGDGVRIGPGMVGRDGVLAFRQHKTGGTAYVPWGGQGRSLILHGFSPQAEKTPLISDQ